MRLLFDQNLSHRLVHALNDVYPASQHVRDAGLNRDSDEAVWTYARDHGYGIVSKDSDFPERALLEGPPPKVIWIRLGNCSTQDTEILLRERSADVAAFESDESAAVLALS